MTKTISESRPSWFSREKLVTAFFASWVFCAFVWHYNNYRLEIPSENGLVYPYPEVETDNDSSPETITKRPTKVWISTSVCFSGNTKFYKKSHYPYLYSTKLSSDLWHRVTNASTIVQVIYDEVDRGSEKMEKFKRELEEGGSRVELVSSNGVSDKKSHGVYSQQKTKCYFCVSYMAVLIL